MAYVQHRVSCCRNKQGLLGNKAPGWIKYSDGYNTYIAATYNNGEIYIGFRNADSGITGPIAVPNGINIE